jgi:hypothetical protein
MVLDSVIESCISDFAHALLGMAWVPNSASGSTKFSYGVKF